MPKTKKKAEKSGCYRTLGGQVKETQTTKLKFWQQNNHPIELSSIEMLQQRLDYLHQNPVESGFVALPEHYLYSSAVNYAGGKGIIPIVFAT